MMSSKPTAAAPPPPQDNSSSQFWSILEISTVHICELILHYMCIQSLFFKQGNEKRQEWV